MKRLALFSLVISSVLIVSCAKKRPLPPRGKRVGQVASSAGLRDIFHIENQLHVDDHCFMVVQLNSGEEVVEVSAGKCPEDGSIVAEPIVTLKLWSGWTRKGNNYQTFLLAGSAASSSENTPVGVVTDISSDEEEEVKLQLDQLCQGSDFMGIELSANCSLKVSVEGQLLALDYDSRRTLEFNLLTRTEQSEKHLAEVDAELAKHQKSLTEHQAHLVKIDGEVTKLNETTEALAVVLIKLTQDFGKFQQQTITAFQVLAKHIDTEFKRLDGRIDTTKEELEGKVSKLREDYEAAVEKLGTDLRTEAEEARQKLKKAMEDASVEARTQLEERLNKTIQTSSQKIQGEIDTINENLEKIETSVGKLTENGLTQEDLSAVSKEALAAATKAEIAGLKAIKEIHLIKLEAARAQNNQEDIVAIEHLIAEVDGQIAALQKDNQ